MKIKIDNKIYVGFDEIISFENYENCSLNQKEYYKKYRTGELEISYKKEIFKIGPEDIFNLNNGIFLKAFPKVSEMKKSLGALLEKEQYVIVLEPKGKDIVLYEYYYEINVFDENKITQKITLPKLKFLNLILENILLFNTFYAKIFDLNLKYLDKEISLAKKVIDYINSPTGKES